MSVYVKYNEVFLGDQPREIFSAYQQTPKRWITWLFSHSWSSEKT